MTPKELICKALDAIEQAESIIQQAKQDLNTAKMLLEQEESKGE